jgi:aminoglycoside 6'-N-acetyltransferase
MKLTHASMPPGPLRLLPLDADLAGPLAEQADRAPQLFVHWPRPAAARPYREEAAFLMSEQAAGRWLAHVVLDADGVPLGQSCYLSIREDHRSVEIGGSWLIPAVHGAGVNQAVKHALIDHAFRSGAERVEFKTDILNLRSQRAIEKIGAVREGVFRRHMRRPDGSWRDTVWYAIIAPDWPGLRDATNGQHPVARTPSPAPVPQGTQ